MFVCCIMTLLTHFFTILLLRSLDCFISTTLYRCYFAFCQSSLNEYEWMNAWFVVKEILIKNSVRQSGIVSPVLFFIYVDGLMCTLRESDFDCLLAARLSVHWPAVLMILLFSHLLHELCGMYVKSMIRFFFTSVMFNAAKSVWLFVTKSKQSYEYVSRFFVGGKSMVTEYIH